MYRIRTLITGGVGGAEVNTMFFNSALLLAQDAADAVRDFWYGGRGVIHTSYTLQVDPVVVEVADFTGLPIGVETVSTASVTGTDSGDPLPGYVQGLVKTNTGVFYGGRQLTGKIFVPGATETRNNNGAPDSTYIATWTGQLAALLAVSDAELMVFSRKNLNANGVTGGTPWSQWAVLKSRRA